MFYDEDELRAFLRGGKSDLVAFERSLGNRHAIHRTICAFANDAPDTGKAGVVFIGMDSDGSCTGIPIDTALLATLAMMRSDGSIQPVPTCASTGPA